MARILTGERPVGCFAGVAEGRGELCGNTDAGETKHASDITVDHISLLLQFAFYSNTLQVLLLR